MQVLTGTSGFSYGEWRGSFYPEDLADADMLAFYASRLASVEVNNTFYQMPKAELLERWAKAVPETFSFALKASRRISHIKRLKNCSEDLGYFFYAAERLGPRLGPVLFQLPPFARKDAGLLRDFLPLLPAGTRAAFEFRHASWFDDEIFALLSEAGAALCGGDADDGDRSPPFVPTASFGYLRLRAPSYDAAALDAWAERIAQQPFERAYVYLKHEVLGPSYAAYLEAKLAGRTPPALPAALPAVPATRKPRRSRVKKKPAPKKPAPE